ncbi:hypothetical protein AYL99_03209 [Fonsecaea erecta]|uniref:BZIP domain-containing protein n=1 Tax=Fonsecaea erecta TaxID=1367422 RepID=A0A178ZW80_9EURO|nr:hypothetical protein AYL99_03209 [Fonsecaea erecta]OAP63982.1 hypothetical protein AYL99_03209 [Fonsecaea erecta]
MNASHIENLSNASTLTPVDLFLVDPGRYGDLELQDEFRRFTNVDSPEAFSGDDAGDSIGMNGLNLVGDVEVSATEQSTMSPSTDSELPAESRSKMRRRAQNRASQRAFRERKEKHLRSLKSTLENLAEKHQKLLDSYSQQSEIVAKLKGRVADLYTQLAALSTYSEQDTDTAIFRIPRPLTTEFQQFDAFSFPPLSAPAGRHSTFRQSQVLDSAELDRLSTLEANDLLGFDDLLNMP